MRNRLWFFPALMGAFAAVTLTIAVVSGSPGWVGLALLLAVFAAAPLSNRVVRRADGSRAHGALLAAGGAVLAVAAALIWVDRRMFYDSGHRGAAVVFVAAPIVAVFAAMGLWHGLRLLANPQPGWFRDRRRSKPHRYRRGIRASDAWRLEPPNAKLDPFVLRPGDVASSAVVSGVVKDTVMVRVELTPGTTLRDLGAPAWVHGLQVEPDVLEFGAPAEEAFGAPTTNP